ncbi:hypothetical protein SRHO_G00113960 [Serrasalmus rhombeus]
MGRPFPLPWRQKTALGGTADLDVRRSEYTAGLLTVLNEYWERVNQTITDPPKVPTHAFKPGDQYANWTAKQYTNDSCYVCHLMPSSVDKHSMATAPLDLSATLQAVAHTCLCLTERVYALASAMRPPRPVYQPLISSTNNMYVCSHAPL